MVKAAKLGLLVFVLAAGAAVVRAQSPAPAPGPPQSPPRSGGGEERPELLPDIGRIGAQVAIFGGASFNPYDNGTGWNAGGYIDLPLRRLPGGRLSYEIYLNESVATSSPFTVTDSVAVVANLAAGASLSASLAGPPQAPFPVTRSVRAHLHLLQVAPFGLKYTMHPQARIRPFVGVGLDFFAIITNDVPEHNESLLFSGTAPFDAALIGGLIGQSPELTARHTPTGQGNIDIGGHAQAGFEARLGGGMSLNLEYRIAFIGSTADRLQSLNAGLGFHW